MIDDDEIRAFRDKLVIAREEVYSDARYNDLTTFSPEWDYIEEQADSYQNAIDALKNAIDALKNAIDALNRLLPEADPQPGDEPPAPDAPAATD